jgi:hypothetical protein
VATSLEGPATALEPGPLLFARFALPPNRLGYCGGDEAASLVQHIEAGIVDEDLLRQCREFEGAYPYLELIAEANRVPDPLDRAVVEGYWLGAAPVSRAEGARFAASIEERFHSRTRPPEWPWLAAKPLTGAVPHHSFHVLEVLPRVGLLRDGLPAALVPVLEQCLVRPARIQAVDGESLNVVAPRLVLGPSRLALVDAGEPERVAWRANGTALLADPAPGDLVALHWGWACDRLTAAQQARLLAVTRASVARASQTV